jgi:predicted ATPase/transcriptional regulator with XRE-family HTH domain
MQHPERVRYAAPVADRPGWSAVLRVIRKARGVTQDGWAARLGVSRMTVQRWERGEAVPDARSEEAILAYCRDRGLFDHADRGPLRRLPASPEELRELLTAARLHAGTRQPAVGPDAPTTTSHLPTPAGSLSLALTSFIGREREAEAVGRALAATRLLTLTGPGGVGKTRLALHVAAGVARDFPDRVTVVALAPIRDPAQVVAAIARTIGVREAGGRSLFESLIAVLQERQLLLVLDNFEHLLPAAPLVTDLLTACPRLQILVTSRAPLRLSGEHEFDIPPLELPDRERLHSTEGLARYATVALFVERAQAVAPAFALTDENAATVAEICARLDGLPLAIELAAVRVKLLSPQSLLSRLGGRLNLLTGGARDLPARQQTLRRAIDWSHDLLSPAEQTLFRQLAVFAGGWTLEAATAVAATGPNPEPSAQNVEQLNSALETEGSEPAVLDGLTALVDQSLVGRVGSGMSEPRFVMLETMREYALDRLEACGQAEALRERHARYYLDLAERAERELQGGEQVTWLDRLAREYDNLRAALTWSIARGETETALRLSGALSGFWDARSHLSEAREWLSRALNAAGGPPPARIKALNWASYFACLQGDYVQAQSQAAQCLAICRDLGSRRGIGYALLMLGQVATEQGNAEQATHLWEESLEVLRDAGDLWGMTRPLNNLGELARARGDYARAQALHEEALAVRRELGDRLGLSNALCDLAYVLWRRGDAPAARARAEEALVLSEHGAHQLGVVVALEALAAIETADRRWERAARLWGAAEALREVIGAPTETIDRTDHDYAVSLASGGMGDAPFALAWAAGRAMRLEQAVAVALGAEDYG